MCYLTMFDGHNPSRAPTVLQLPLLSVFQSSLSSNFVVSTRREQLSCSADGRLVQILLQLRLMRRSTSSCLVQLVLPILRMGKSLSLFRYLGSSDCLLALSVLNSCSVLGADYMSVFSLWWNFSPARGGETGVRLHESFRPRLELTAVFAPKSFKVYKFKMVLQTMVRKMLSIYVLQFGNIL